MYNMGISGIGWNPLGNVGLGMTGAYGSYDAYMPSTMGMNYGMGMMNPMSSMGGMMGGMMGAYPTFMAQMQNVQNMLEKNQAQHSSAMHHILHENQYNAAKRTHEYTIAGMIPDADLEEGIGRLISMRNSNNWDGFCTEYRNLKEGLSHRYADELARMGDKINPSKVLNNIINNAYGRYHHGQTGQTVYLDDDVKNNAYSPFMSGFMQAYRPGSSERYSDEVLNYCLGHEIDQK